MRHDDPDGSAPTSGATVDALASEVGDRQVLVVSNRQPYSHEYEDGEVTVSRPAGGLTSALDPVLQAVDGSWIAWGSGEADREVVDDHDRVGLPPESPAYDLKRVWLTDEQVAGYYYGYSNQVLWPLCHNRVNRATFDDEFFTRYREVNEVFADAVVERSEGSPLVWFQDYHLALAPRQVRARGLTSAVLAHFWHIPWPSWDDLRASPEARDLLDGLLANDLVGFHTERYCRNFLDCVSEGLDATVDWSAGVVTYRGRETYVRSFPLGVDTAAFERRATSNEARRFWESFTDEHGLAETRVAVGVDRLDYTKGILERLAALERLWERRPRWRGRLTYVQKGSESRTEIEAYRTHQERIEETVADLNERFGTADWQPVVYLTGMLSQEALCGLYRGADLALVSPVQDGMNLVAKEYVAANVDDDGVLLLSELAGASEELEDALSIHPYDTDAFAATIEAALTMPDVERRRRMRRMRAYLRANDVYAWVSELFRTVSAIDSTRRSHPDESRTSTPGRR